MYKRQESWSRSASGLTVRMKFVSGYFSAARLFPPAKPRLASDRKILVIGKESEIWSRTASVGPLLALSQIAMVRLE